jgi:polyferredoxin
MEKKEENMQETKAVSPVREKKKLTRKQENQRRSWIRFGIQLIFFLFFASAYNAAFAGVKYVFTQIGTGQPLALTSFVSILLVLCLYTIIFGRFFCGFACAFGSFGDWLRSIYLYLCKKLKIKTFQIPAKVSKVSMKAKYLVLLAIVLLCFKNTYTNYQGTSPWDVFSRVYARQFNLSGFGIGIAILFVIMVGMLLEERFFCKYLCPMGAIFSLLPVLPHFSLHRDRENCIKGCSACEKVCPCRIGLPEDGSLGVEGDCFQCQKCQGVCPKKHIHTGIKGLNGNEIWFTALRAGILIVLFILLDV